MTLKNTPERWGAISQLLHWLTLVLLVWISWVGLTMVDLPRTPRAIEVYALHKSLGLTLLAVVAIRLGWRVYAGAPAHLASTPGWQHRIATLTHFALYVLMIALPLSGWLLNSAAGYPLQWFELFNLPALSARNDELHELSEELHEAGFWVLVALVAAHAGAALYHHLFQHDTTLTRMLPARARATPPSTES